jgi:hypothetical protein
MRVVGICLLAGCCLSFLSLSLSLSLSLGPPEGCHAADPGPRTGAGPGANPGAAAEPADEPDEASQRDETFRRLVANVTLSGHFTLDGDRQTKLEREEYVITGAMKLGKGDRWALTSRIRYGQVDLTLPVPVQVKWAGDTPVITLDKVGLPGLGTFSARVVLDQGRYAGTWSHDDVGGHLFGTITANAENAKPTPRPATGNAPTSQGPVP